MSSLIDEAINKQEMLRRAVEVGCTSLQKINSISQDPDNLKKDLSTLVSTAVGKLTTEVKSL